MPISPRISRMISPLKISRIKHSITNIYDDLKLSNRAPFVLEDLLLKVPSVCGRRGERTKQCGGNVDYIRDANFVRERPDYGFGLSSGLILAGHGSLMHYFIREVCLLFWTVGWDLRTWCTDWRNRSLGFQYCFRRQLGFLEVGRIRPGNIWWEKKG